MSQLLGASGGGGGGGGVLTTTGNDSVIVSPDGSGNLNLRGDGTLLTVSGSTNTETITMNNGTDGQLLIGNSLGGTPAWATVTAGTGISLTPGHNSLTITATGVFDPIVPYTPVNHAASPYTVLSGDYYLSADVTAGVITILLPNGPSTGRCYVVKDKVGLAATSNITITTVGGSVTIDGATSFVMNTAYESVELIFNGSNYEVW